MKSRMRIIESVTKKHTNYQGRICNETKVSVVQTACLLSYMILLYELWRLCQFGGVRRRLIVMIVAGVLFVISFLLWVVWYRAARQSVDWVKPPKWIFLGKLSHRYTGNSYGRRRDLLCSDAV